MTDRSFCFSLSIISFFFVVVGTNNFVLYQYCSWIFFFIPIFCFLRRAQVLEELSMDYQKKALGT